MARGACRDERPGLDAALKAVARREIDLLVAWSVDRLGRSLTGLLELPTELHAKKVDLYLHQQGLDTSTPSGKAMFQMMGVFAEFERAMIRERVLAGMARASESGTKSGKAIGRPRIAADTEAEIRSALQRGDMDMRKIARHLDVATGTVQRIAREMALASA